MGEPTTYFKIDRQLLSSDLWLDEPFTKAQAWIDLIGRANYSETTHIYGSKAVKLKRGQLITSSNALSQRWGWSRKKVLNFLTALESAKMATVKGTPEGTTITIENYNKFQSSGTTKDTAGSTSRVQAGYKQDTHYKNNNKNIQKKESSLEEEKHEYGNVLLTDSEWSKLDGMVKEPGKLIEIVDRVSDWLEDNPLPPSKHMAVMKKFLRTDGVIR